MKRAENRRTGKQNDAKRMHSSVLCFFLVAAMAASCGTAGLVAFPETALAEEETFCGLEEHEHNEDCYERVLTCGQEEREAIEGHTHTESCYQTETLLICGLEEDENHTHNESCYLISQRLICDQAEREAVEGHTHTEDCYGVGTELVCELEEHTHTDECLSDKTADLEDSSIWEATLPQELSGIWEDDVIAVAVSQLGYTESTRNFLYNENGTDITEKRKGYTRYGAWYGDPYGDWCAMFASFCLYYAGVPMDAFPRSSNCVTWTKALQRLDLYEDAKTSAYIPEKGDLIFFDKHSNDSKSTDHVGIVEEVEYTTVNGKKQAVSIHTIEGNSGNCVKRNTYDVDNGTIVGYGVLPKKGNTGQAEAIGGMILDLTNMLPVLSADGYECIGMISIPRYGIELPVVDERNHLTRRILPVHFGGFVRVNEPVLCGYDHNRCFGNLKYLTAGDSIFFVSVQGDVTEYQVEEALLPQEEAAEEEAALQETAAEEEAALQEPDAEETADAWDLTMHVRTIGGEPQATIHCSQQI